MKHLFLFLTLLLPLATFATDYEPKDVSEIRAQYNLLVDLKNDKAISESVFEDKTTQLKQLATEKFQVNLDGMDLQQVVPAQRIDWIGSAFYVVSALLLLLLILPLLKKFEKPIRKLIMAIVNNEFLKILAKKLLLFIKKTWEFFAYAILAISLFYFKNEFIVLFVSFLLSPLLSYSIYSRVKDKEESYRFYGNVTSWSLTIIWGLIAYFFNNAFVGFMSVAAFISSIGFALVMFPGVIGIGFKKHNGPFVLRLTGFTFVLSLFSWLLFYTNYKIGRAHV